MTAQVKSCELKIRKDDDIWYLEGVSISLTLTLEDIESITTFVKIHGSNIDFQDEEQVLAEYVNVLNKMIQEGEFTAADFREA